MELNGPNHYIWEPILSVWITCLVAAKGITGPPIGNIPLKNEYFCRCCIFVHATLLTIATPSNLQFCKSYASENDSSLTGFKTGMRRILFPPPGVINTTWLNFYLKSGRCISEPQIKSHTVIFPLQFACCHYLPNCCLLCSITLSWCWFICHT